MNTLVLLAPGQIELRDIPIPEIGEDEVLVRVRACNIDRMTFDQFSGSQQRNGAVTPLFGVAGTGIVTSTGSEVNEFTSGDRVVFWGGVSVYSEYCNVSTSRLYHLPEQVGFEEGTAVHLFPEIIRGIEQSQPAEQTVFISGAGSVGILCAQICRAYGVGRIIISDLYDQRLRRAQHIAADVTINASTEDVVRRIQEETEEQGVDICMECSGEGDGFRNGEAVLQTGGRLVVMGRHTEPASLDLADWADRSLTLVMAREQSDETRQLVEKGLQLIDLGMVELRPLLTHVFPFHRATDAFELIRDQPGRTLTVTLQP